MRAAWMSLMVLGLLVAASGGAQAGMAKAEQGECDYQGDWRTLTGVYRSPLGACVRVEVGIMGNDAVAFARGDARAIGGQWVFETCSEYVGSTTASSCASFTCVETLLRCGVGPEAELHRGDRAASSMCAWVKAWRDGVLVREASACAFA